jgi:hypothetical protein
MADETERELSTAQGAGGMGPAHGQAPPKAAQGVQRTQNSNIPNPSRTKTKQAQIGWAAWPAGSSWGESSDLFGSMADETENQGPNIPNPD